MGGGEEGKEGNMKGNNLIFIHVFALHMHCVVIQQYSNITGYMPVYT